VALTRPPIVRKLLNPTPQASRPSSRSVVVNLKDHVEIIKKFRGTPAVLHPRAISRGMVAE